MTFTLHLSLLCNYVPKNSYYVFVVSKVFFIYFCFPLYFLFWPLLVHALDFASLFLVFRGTSAFELHLLNFRILTLSLCISFCMVTFMPHCDFNFSDKRCIFNLLKFFLIICTSVITSKLLNKNKNPGKIVTMDHWFKFILLPWIRIKKWWKETFPLKLNHYVLPHTSLILSQTLLSKGNILIIEDFPFTLVVSICLFGETKHHIWKVFEVVNDIGLFQFDIFFSLVVKL